MSDKLLLREYYELCEGGVCQDILTEAEKKFVAEGGMILSGIMQMCETLNGNGRVYTNPVLEREIKKYQKLIIGMELNYNHGMDPNGLLQEIH